MNSKWQLTFFIMFFWLCSFPNKLISQNDSVNRPIYGVIFGLGGINQKMPEYNSILMTRQIIKKKLDGINFIHLSLGFTWGINNFNFGFGISTFMDDEKQEDENNIGCKISYLGNFSLIAEYYILRKYYIFLSAYASLGVGLMDCEFQIYKNKPDSLSFVDVINQKNNLINLKGYPYLYELGFKIEYPFFNKDDNWGSAMPIGIKCGWTSSYIQWKNLDSKVIGMPNYILKGAYIGVVLGIYH